MVVRVVKGRSGGWIVFVLVVCRRSIVAVAVAVSRPGSGEEGGADCQLGWSEACWSGGVYCWLTRSGQGSRVVGAERKGIGRRCE